MRGTAVGERSSRLSPYERERCVSDLRSLRNADVGGPGGLESFCQKYAESFHRWWDDLGDPRLDAETAALLVQGVAAESADGTQAELSRARDELITAMLKTTANLRRK